MTDHNVPDDDEAFNMGVPTEVDSLRHQCSMLIEELHEAWADVRKTKGDMRTLLAMHDQQARELSTLKAEHGRVVWRLSERLRQDGVDAGGKLNAFATSHRHF